MGKSRIRVSEQDVEWVAIRAQGAGGQNVNKVATAVQLRYDIRQASLPEPVRQRLLDSADQRISNEGVLVIKAQRHRTQARNRDDALQRLQALIDAACHEPKKRKATRPPRSAKRKRLDNKTRKGRTKALRGKPGVHE